MGVEEAEEIKTRIRGGRKRRGKTDDGDNQNGQTKDVEARRNDQVCKDDAMRLENEGRQGRKGN